MSNPFDMGGMGGMGGLGGLLGGLTAKVEEMKRKTAETRVEGSAGGKVKIVMGGDFEVHSVTIDPSVMGDREMLEDLVRAAVSDATRKAKDEMQKGVQQLAGGLPLPPGLLGF
jgi:DNA-binding YbaB/EbfC family protein